MARVKASKYTKSTRGKLWTLRIVRITTMLIPMIVYAIMGLVSGALVYQKIALVASVVVALILTVFNFFWKSGLRSPLWIILIGLHTIMADKLLPLVFILAGVSILDDFVFRPLIKKYHTKLIAHKTMDERI